jgi:hypothetical protein
MEEEWKLEPTEEEMEDWKLEPMGYIIIRGLAEGAIDNQLQETGDLIIDPTQINGFFLCKLHGKDYEPQEGEFKFEIYENMHFDTLPKCQKCERYFFVTPTQKGIIWLVDRVIERIKEIGSRRLTSLAEVVQWGDIKWAILAEARQHKNFREVLDDIKVSLVVPSENLWKIMLIVAGEIFGEAGQKWLRFAKDIRDIEVAGESEIEVVKLRKMKILREILP